MELKAFSGRDFQGNVLSNATVWVYLPGTNTLAAGLYDENGAALTNPFQTPVSGLIQLSMPDGYYDLRIKSGLREATQRMQFNSTTRFLKPKSTDPSQRDDGSVLVLGDRYLNTNDGIERIYKDSGWAPNNVDGQSLASAIGATLLGCKSTGTGSVRRPLQSRLNERGSVKDFGAIGDGTYHPVSEWYTAGFSAYLGYADLAAVQADYPHVKSATDSIDWAACQAALDAYAGASLDFPLGSYVITDTLYVEPGTCCHGVSVGDNWGVTSSSKGTRIKTYGTGVKRIWTDVGLPNTPAGTLVDAPRSVSIVFTGSGSFFFNITLEGGSLPDGSDCFDYGFLLPSVRRIYMNRVETVGTFAKTGFLVDATWSSTNTALRNLHKNTYGREIYSDQASNENIYDNCWFKGGNWGMYTKGTDRTDTSANIWSPGGVSDFNGINSRIDNTPLGTRPNFPEDSGGYYRDLHNGFQNRHHTNCRIGSQSAYGVFLDRGEYEQFDGFYGETRPDRCVTSLLTKTVDTLGAVLTPALNGGTWSGTGGSVPTMYRVYLTDTARIDVLAEKLRIGGTMTTDTGSIVVWGVSFDADAGRAFILAQTITGTITAGQTLTQAAGQTAANGGYYGTERSGQIITSGQTSFKAPSGLVLYLGATIHSRYLRTVGLCSTRAYLTGTATDEVSFNCDNATNINWFINRYGLGTATTARLRFLGTSLDSYQQADLGSVQRPWGTVRAVTSTISTSDARHKTPVRDFTEREIAASKQMLNEIGFYQFLASIAEKEPEDKQAREHCGMTVQRVIEVMESHNLDPFNYSFICHDRWPDEVETQNGKQVITTEGGDLYSFRISGLILFMLKGLASLEGRVSALEARP